MPRIPSRDISYYTAANIKNKVSDKADRLIKTLCEGAATGDDYEEAEQDLRRYIAHLEDTVTEQGWQLNPDRMGR